MCKIVVMTSTFASCYLTEGQQQFVTEKKNVTYLLLPIFLAPFILFSSAPFLPPIIIQFIVNDVHYIYMQPALVSLPFLPLLPLSFNPHSFVSPAECVKMSAHIDYPSTLLAN